MTGSPHSAAFSFAYPTDRAASIVTESIAQEVGGIDDARSSTTVDRHERTLAVRVTADDLVALRAATNTWLSLIAVAERSLEIGTRHP